MRPHAHHYVYSLALQAAAFSPSGALAAFGRPGGGSVAAARIYS